MIHLIWVLQLIIICLLIITYSRKRYNFPCWFCGGETTWQADFSFEDYGLEGDGVVAVHKCWKCGAIIEVKQGDNE